MIGVPYFGAQSLKFTGTSYDCFAVKFRDARGDGEAELGKAPGMSPSSRSVESLTGAVLGVRFTASCESETLFGVDEFLLLRRALLRRAMSPKASRASQTIVFDVTLNSTVGDWSIVECDSGRFVLALAVHQKPRMMTALLVVAAVDQATAAAPDTLHTVSYFGNRPVVPYHAPAFRLNALCVAILEQTYSRRKTMDSFGSLAD